MFYHSDDAILLAHGDNRLLLHSLSDFEGKLIGSIHDVLVTAIVLSHFDESAFWQMAQVP